MKKMAMFGALALSSLAFAAEPTLRLATDGTYPPFAEMNAQGKMVGFDIDIGMALCAEMKVKCVFQQTAWEGLIPALKTHRVDAIVASMNATPERKKSVAFTHPYYNNPGIFVRPKGSKIEITPAGLKGKVIGVLRGSVFDNYATAKLAKMAEIRRYSSQDEANLDAKSGRIDVLFADKIFMHKGFLDRSIGKSFEIFGPELNDPQFFGDGISIAVRKSDTALADRFNKALAAIRKNGVYKKINDKYFAYDIYGVPAAPAAKQ